MASKALLSELVAFESLVRDEKGREIVALRRNGVRSAAI
jgi:hypothetical protein